MENSKSSDKEEHIEIQTFGENSEGNVQEDEKQMDTTSKDIDLNVKPSCGAESSTSQMLNNERDNVPDVPTDRESVPKNNGTASSSMFEPIERIICNQPTKIPQKTVSVTVEKQPATCIILSCISFFINPLCGALAIWQSCKYMSDILFIGSVHKGCFNHI